MRTVAAAILFCFCGALLLLSYSVLENPWAEYQDSPDSTYIEIAAIEVGLALVGGFLLLRHRYEEGSDSSPSAEASLARRAIGPRPAPQPRPER